MIKGYFDSLTGRPYLEAFLFIPRLRLSGVVSFLVDTGCDFTCLMPGDGLALGINYDELPAPTRLLDGIGGRVGATSLEAVVSFTEEGGPLRYYWVDLDIYGKRPESEHLPSLLGRNILDRWRMDYDPASHRLEFEVRSADYTRP